VRGGLALVLAFLAAPWNSDSHAAQRRRSEASMCATAEWVFIGTVVERESAYDPRPGVLISSRVSMQVEAVAHGDPPPRVSFGVMGGVVGSTRNMVGDQPEAEVGARYLIFGRLIDVPTEEANRERLLVDSGVPDSRALKLIRFFELEPEFPVPGSEEFRAIWSEHCLPGAVEGESARPTQRYLQYLPASLLAWCEHY